MTLGEFERLPDDGNKHELSEGELIVMPPVKFLHTLVAAAILDILRAYLREHPIAGAFAEAGYVLSHDPLIIRQPDISVLSNQRIAATQKDGWVEHSPELAVEIVSPSDFAQDLEVKVEQYLRYGAQQVWIVFPKQKQVHVHQPGSPRMVLNESETLPGGDLLPGFSVKVSDLFT